MAESPRGSAPLLGRRQAEARLSLTAVATCVSMFLRQACGVRGAQGRLQPGAPDSGRTQRADAHEPLSPGPPSLNLPCRPS